MKNLEIVIANQENWINKIAEIDNGKDIKTVTDEHALDIQNLLICKELSVDQLRKCVSWVNYLDMEATKLEQLGCLNTKIEMDEYTARRVSHKAGRLVLNKVKSNSKYQTYLSLFNRGMI